MRAFSTVSLCLLLLSSCGQNQEPVTAEPPRPDGPDILLVTIDTLRADRVGAYGDSLAQTPNLDGLARQGVLFREAIAAAPLTLPSHASMLTAVYPAGHGLRDNGGFRLAPDVPTLAERLTEGGYRTGAFVSAYVLDSAWGLDRGFDVYRAPFHPQDVASAHAFGELEIPSADTVNAALAFLRAGGDGPTFCWVHLYDPHAPWVEHPGWEGDPYRGEVAFADALLGRLLAGVGDDALIVVTSDHGEGLWDHGEREHGLLVTRSSTRVPLVVRPPGGLDLPLAEVAPLPGIAGASRRPAGVDDALVLDPVPDEPQAARIVDRPVSGVDVPATIADYAGLEPWGDGVSLRAAVRGEAFERGPVYSETFFPRFHYGWSELAVVQDGATRLRVGPTLATVNLATDKAELQLETVEQHDLLGHALTWLGEGSPQPGPVPSDALEKLAALGYVQPLRATPLPREDLADPRDRTEVLGRLHALEADPDGERSIRGLRALVRDEPTLVEGWLALALALHGTGHVEDALGATLSALELQPDHTMALSNGAFLCRALGQRDLGVELARRIQALNPSDPRGYRLEVVFWVDAERPDEVVRVARAGLVASPGDPQLHYLEGLALIFTDSLDLAVQALEAAAKHGSRAGDIQLYLGTAHDKAGRVDQALAAYQAYSRENPDDLRGVAAAAWMLYQADECERAAPLLVNLVERGHGRDPRIREAHDICSAP